MAKYIEALGVIPKNSLSKLIFWGVAEGMLLALFFSGMQLLVYSLLALVFSYMCIEDYFTREVDMRLCLVLIALVAFSGKETFLVDFGLGYVFFHVWYYLLCRKVKITVCSNDRVAEEMGFLPSLGVGILIWCLGRPFVFLDFFRWDNLSLFCLAILGCTWWAILRWHWQRVSKEENMIVQSGFGEGDIYICAIGFSFFGPAEFLVILFLSLIAHLILYKFQYYFRR